jgi:hypothetical protein
MLRMIARQVCLSVLLLKKESRRMRFIAYILQRRFRLAVGILLLLQYYLVSIVNWLTRSVLKKENSHMRLWAFDPRALVRCGPQMCWLKDSKLQRLKLRRLLRLKLKLLQSRNLPKEQVAVVDHH